VRLGAGAARRGARGVAGLLLVAVADIALAGPYRPASEDAVLERLPLRLATPRAAQTLRGDGPSAAALARAHIERARASGDPRELGYARGVLAPWWNAADAPDAVLLLRATLRQSQHDFSGALDDLDRLLARRPDDAQAWLTRATILRVQGRPQEALAACGELAALASPFITGLCTQSMRGLSGQLPSAIAALEAMRPQLPLQAPSIAAWFFAERADMALRAGDVDGADAIFRTALAQHPGDLDLRAAYADLLLDRAQPRAVLDLIAADTAVESLRLRRALALQAVKDPAFTALDAAIRDGFAAARRRGEALHLREEARYLLATGGDPALALRYAQDNWALQHEPWDARLLVEAAAAAGRPQAAQPVQAWMAQTGYQDVRLVPAGSAR
jgi:tetratricopeptide (TPR) repeat protein